LRIANGQRAGGELRIHKLQNWQFCKFRQRWYFSGILCGLFTKAEFPNCETFWLAVLAKFIPDFIPQP
jgi:hypothetical protein